MQSNDHNLALKAAKLYYHQGLTTEQIAQEFGVSRPKISRLLSFAKRQGLVQIRIIDPLEDNRSLARDLQTRFGLRAVHTVPVPDHASEAEALDRVAIFAAMHLNALVQPGTVLAVAWGNTLASITQHLVPRPTPNVRVVQLNGSGNLGNIGNVHVNEVLLRLAQNFGAAVNLFPVPAFFDYPETKTALWRERSVRQILALQRKADVFFYSIGAVRAGLPSYVYQGGFLDKQDQKSLAQEKIVGDIATVFFRHDGSFDQVDLNERASGPDLGLLRCAKKAVCVVAGKSKAEALLAALRGSLLNELIVDEPTARMLLD